MRFLALALMVTVSMAASAEKLVLKSPSAQVALLELYTSEGCSSCPPADRWVSKMVSDERLWKQVVPVAFHVDYWDYIGWKDNYAEPEYGARQRTFARQGHLRSVYTPGLVVAGQEWRGWFRRPVLAIDEPPTVGPMKLEIGDAHIDVEYSPERINVKDVEAHVAILGFGISTDVKAGENHGRKLEHDFVVLGYERAHLVKSGDRYAVRIKRPALKNSAPRLGIAAWVNRTGDQRPLQSVGGWLSQ